MTPKNLSVKRVVFLMSGGGVVAVLLILAFTSWDDLRRWYYLWPDFESVGRNAQGFREYRHRQSRIIFVSLPGGTALMGTSDDELKEIIDSIL